MFFKSNKQISQVSLKSRSIRGSAIADAPGAIWMLFMCLAFPAMCFASLFYRATFVYFATRDSCYKAAKSSTFTLGNTNAQAAFNTDIAAFSGISNATETLYIITQPTNGGVAPAPTSSPLSTVDLTNNVYFIKAVSTTQVNPLFTIGPSFLGISIPGLTGPYPLTVVAQCYVENPTGLTN